MGTGCALSSESGGQTMDHLSAEFEVLVARCLSGSEGSSHWESGSSHQLEMWGPLPDSWAGNFALHCFGRGITIKAGDAIEVSTGRWAARFELAQVREPGVALEGDFMWMARRPPRGVPMLPAPEVVVEVSDASSDEELLLAQVRGRDSIGLLADVLRRFGALGLAPRRFSLRSDGGCVFDHFWLEQVAAATPRREVAISRLERSRAREPRRRWPHPPEEVCG